MRQSQLVIETAQSLGDWPAHFNPFRLISQYPVEQSCNFGAIVAAAVAYMHIAADWQSDYARGGARLT